VNIEDVVVGDFQRH